MRRSLFLRLVFVGAGAEAAAAPWLSLARTASSSRGAQKQYDFGQLPAPPVSSTLSETGGDYAAIATGDVS